MAMVIVVLQASQQRYARKFLGNGTVATRNKSNMPKGITCASQTDNIAAQPLQQRI